MSEQFVLLEAMDEIWAKMLMEVLKDNHIPCTAKPVFGFALTAKTGGSDLWKIYVPAEDVERGKELVGELFSGGGEAALAELFDGEENKK